MSQNNQSVESNNSPRQASPQIKANDETLKGEYANAMQVMHTKEEFIMDFISNLPPVASLVSRVIVSPGQMKLIARALNEKQVPAKNKGRWHAKTVAQVLKFNKRKS